MIKQQAAALADANSKREELTKQLSEVQEKSPQFREPMPKHGYFHRPIFW